MNVACPSAADLIAGLSGSGNPDAMASLAQHVENCPSCQERLQRLASAPDTLDHGLHDAGSAAAVPDDPAFQRAVQRLLTKPERLEPGEMVDEYRLEELLGEGGMGAVWKARHTRLDMVVALKVVGRRLSGDPAAEERFQREMKAVGQLRHPNIIRAHDAGEAAGRAYLVMEYSPGVDLADLVQRHGPLAPAEACEAVRQAALGLQHAHEAGLVHRDVKPSNLLLTPDGVVKVLDLGLARWEAAAEPVIVTTGDSTLHDELTGASRRLGTRDYVAPEQWRDPRAVNARADVYGLGCTLVFLLTGKPPRTAPAVSVGVPTVVLRRLLAPEVAERYPSAAAVAAALAPRARGANLCWLLDSNAQATQPHKRIPRHAAAVALAVAIIAVAFGLAFSLRSDDTTPVDGAGGHPVGLLPMTAAEAKSLQGQWAAIADRPVRSKHGAADVNCVLIPPGEFGLSGECRVAISRPYLIGTHEITVGQFRKFVEASGYVTEAERSGKGGWLMDRTNYHAMQQRRPEYVWTSPGYAVLTDDHPATQVSWNDAIAFCAWLTSTDTIKFRLPTEAEWRWACRAGSTGEFYFGDNANLQKDNAWYVMNAFEQPQPVGKLESNVWGLYDALGNAAEWCADGFNDYPSGQFTDYHAAVKNDRRVLAGGSHINTRVNCIMRDPGAHSAGMSFVGFRVVGELPH